MLPACRRNNTLVCKLRGMQAFLAERRARMAFTQRISKYHIPEQRGSLFMQFLDDAGQNLGRIPHVPKFTVFIISVVTAPNNENQ